MKEKTSARLFFKYSCAGIYSRQLSIHLKEFYMFKKCDFSTFGKGALGCAVVASGLMLASQISAQVVIQKPGAIKDSAEAGRMVNTSRYENVGLFQQAVKRHIPAHEVL
jgi:hypothetical protein